jgi:hypothetical protein
MLANGEGGDADRVKAWGWLKLAEKNGRPDAASAAAALEARFTAADRAAADALGKDAATPSPGGE